jgi:hypothetical protein
LWRDPVNRATLSGAQVAFRATKAQPILEADLCIGYILIHPRLFLFAIREYDMA